ALAADSGADIPAVGLDGRELTLKSADIQDLRAGLRGELVTAAHPDYASARRLWNPAFDRHPSLIVRCAGAADVRRAVSFSGARGLLTAVRAGGHSVSGQSGCDRGLVIDLSRMRAVEVDPVAKLARVEAGALLGELDREALAFGLATPVGTVADTGVAGLTLGGGVGRLARKFGLTCDNLVAAELVTADGEWRRASATENADLLWALRGGGGNFGVVTSFTFRLHEVTPVMYGGNLQFPITGGREMLRSLGDIIAAAPDELYGDVAMGTAPSDGLMMWLQRQGGAISRVPPKASAYFNRGASHNVGVFDSWQMSAADVERRTEWVRHTWTQIEPLTRGQYVNLAATDDRETRVHAAYGDNYPRLAALKKRYDPNNLFRLNANIKPA